MTLTGDLRRYAREVENSASANDIPDQVSIVTRARTRRFRRHLRNTIFTFSAIISVTAGIFMAAPLLSKPSDAVPSLTTPVPDSERQATVRTHCSGPTFVETPEQSDLKLQLAESPIIVKSGSTVDLEVTLVNAGQTPITLISARALDPYIIANETVLFGPEEQRASGRSISLVPGGSAQYNLELVARKCTAITGAGYDSGTPLAPGQYQVYAQLSLQLRSPNKAQVIQGGPWLLHVSD